ncbi:MSMEG_0567/Sll0786 family nitrogen starvation N-acetyltransferase [Pseudomonas sp. SH1-B]
MSVHAFALNDDTFRDFLAGDLLVKPATERWEREAYYRLRRAVFAEEQGLFAQDRDAHDFQALPIVAVAYNCGVADRVIGAVRIYEQEKGLWYGGRLCVEPEYRRHRMIGKALVNEAVSRAIDLGCRRFLATVQQTNEAYFQGLHWDSLQHITLLERPHVLMQAQLQHYPFMPREVSLLPVKEPRHG